MHLVWDRAAVPAAVEAFADLITQSAGWERIRPRGRQTPPDAVQLDWSDEPPTGPRDLPLLWVVRRPTDPWRPDADDNRPRHLRSPKALRPTEIVYATPTADDGPLLPLLRGEPPAPLPNAIVLARSPSGDPVATGLASTGGAPPALFLGVDLGTRLLGALAADRERTLAMLGRPVAALFGRTGEAESLVKTPWANHAVSGLLWCLEWLARQAAIPRVRLTPYPEGKSWALALSHDVDAARWTPVHALKQVRHGGWRAGRSLIAGRPRAAVQAVMESARVAARRDFWAVEECLAADEALDVRSSFYFYSKQDSIKSVTSDIYDPDYSLDNPRIHETVGAVVDRGFEVGLHGSYLSGADADLLSAEREALEACLGQAVQGVRQHFLRGEAPEVWRVQAAAGLQYDTSWTYRDRAGFRAGLALPYRVWDGEEERPIDLWELPLVLMDGQLFDRECGEAGAARATAERVLTALRDCGGAGAADWHQRFFADPGHAWRGAYEWLVGWAREQGAWLGPVGTLVDWWRQRAALAWTVAATGRNWEWTLRPVEPVAHLVLHCDGVVPGSVEVMASARASVQSTPTGATVRVAELGPDSPLVIRAQADVERA